MSRINVKIIARGQNSSAWKKQIPGNSNNWGDCAFIFDQNADKYDWLVVIDDISRNLNAAPESLACADQHTLLVTTEPPTITRYGQAFTRQFEHVLTSQDHQALPHPNRIHSHTGNLWFNGHSFDELEQLDFSTKTDNFSTVCSSKQQKHTIHQDRFKFTQWLKQQVPELEIYGHGVRFVQNKFEALDRYRWHLAIENHIALHHWTEKLADPLLSGTIPIYYGCPNIADYFPAESYLAIDIQQPTEALEAIQTLISDPKHYAQRLDALKEAQRRILYEYNLLAMLDRFIANNHKPNQKRSTRRLYGRKQMRARNPKDLISHLLWGARKSLHCFKTQT